MAELQPPRLGLPNETADNGRVGRNPNLISVAIIGQTLLAEVLEFALAERNFDTHRMPGSVQEVAADIEMSNPDLCLVVGTELGYEGKRELTEGVNKWAAVGRRVIVLSRTVTFDRGEIAPGVSILYRNIDITELDSSLRRVHTGETILDKPERTYTQEALDEETRQARRLAEYLTPREHECLWMLYNGLSTEAMMKAMGVCKSTMRTHVAGVLEKLSLHSRVQAAAFAAKYLSEDWQ
jgi:two-component system nitrate/nitrite response regulator NarL